MLLPICSVVLGLGQCVTKLRYVGSGALPTSAVEKFPHVTLSAILRGSPMAETLVDAGFEVWRGGLVLLVVSGEFFFAKVEVTSSSLVTRSRFSKTPGASRPGGLAFGGNDF